MSIYKRGKKWWFAVYRPGGTIVRGSCGTDDEAVARSVERTMIMAAGRQTDAERLHAMIDALLGQSKKAQGLPLDEVWAEYCRVLTARGAGLSDRTLDGRRRAVSRFQKWARDHYQAATTAEGVDRACALAYAGYLAKKGTAGKTRRNIVFDLQAVWRGLRTVRDGIDDPWQLVVPDKGETHGGLAFTREQETAVLEAADKAGHGWGIACRIARCTGLRYGDVATLTWKRVDLECGWVTLRPSKTRRHGISVRSPLSCEALACVRAYRPSEASPDAFVFPDLGNAYPLRFKPRSFQHVLKAAGLDGAGFTFHSWRHTFRTRLSEAGVSDEIANRLGGWRNTSTSIRYDHDGRAKELQEAVNLIDGPTSPPRPAAPA